MKKTISIIVAAAALIAALAVFVCTDVKFDNPLDEKGSNYLGGYMSGLKGSDEDRCLKLDGSGKPVFWSDTTCLPNCDGIDPNIDLVGPGSVTTTTKPGSEDAANVLKKWLHLDGGAWNNIITYGPGNGGSQQPFPQEPCLTKDGGDGSCINLTNKITKDTIMLEPSTTYKITYKVVKDTCNGKVPSAPIARVLMVTQYIPPVGDLKINLLGENPAQVKVGAPYVDGKVIVSVGGTPNPGALDSVVVRNSQNDVVSKVVKPNDDFSGVKLSDNPPAGSTFTVTYYASYTNPSTGQTATPQTAVRTVQVIPDESTLSAVIVLNPYKHKLSSGKVVEGPDTMLYIGSANYVEKGAKAYKSTGEEIVGSNVVNITPPAFGSDNITQQVDYRVEAGTGYGSASKKRNVHMVDKTCDDKTEPTVNVSTSWTGEIPAGTVWDYDRVWYVLNKDENGGGAAFKYFIDFDGLDPNKPVAKSGGYKITFVGLGKCGGINEKEVPLTVK